MLHIDSYSAFGFKTMGSGSWEKYYCLKNPACCGEPSHVYSRNTSTVTAFNLKFGLVSKPLILKS